jgi:hypothetical protein
MCKKTPARSCKYLGLPGRRDGEEGEKREEEGRRKEGG